MKNNQYSVHPIPFSIGKNVYLDEICSIISNRTKSGDQILFVVDNYFKKKFNFKFPSRKLNFHYTDSAEPSTDGIKKVMRDLKSKIKKPKIVFGIGGGIALDTAKAISNLFNNPGHPEIYQGWDLLRKPGVYKVGIPTISGTGAEASRTCVLVNSKTGLKLGMNSDFTYFDHVILDYDLTKSVPKKLFLQTLTDAYFHAMELIEGKFRNEIADDFAKIALNYIDEIFLSNKLNSADNRKKAMLASYYAGFAISLSMVGLIHPFSASIGKIYEIPHTRSNLIAFRGLKDFYPQRWKELNRYFRKQNMQPPCLELEISSSDIQNLIDLTIIHEKPLSNMLGNRFKKILNKNKLIKIFEGMQ